jgi:RNA polymerase sigma-70 factor (ECF subfamily)
LLVHRYQQRVYRLAVSVLGPGLETEAEDLAQDVFVQVFRKLPSFRGECAFSTWLYRLTYNRALDHRRRARRRRPHLPEEALADVADQRRSSDPYQAAAAGQRLQQVQACLEGLPDLQRTVIHLYYWLNHSVHEIAAMLTLNPGTVKSHLWRARQALANQLPEDLRDE